MDFKYEELLRALNDFQVGGILICESPNLEDDARLLQTRYTNLHNKITDRNNQVSRINNQEKY